MSPRFSLCLLALALLPGCASYTTPGRGANLEAFGVGGDAAAATATDRRDALSDRSVVQAAGKRPLATFPTGIAVARVQAPGYQSRTAQGFGTGRYSVVTTRDIEKPEQIQRLAGLPLVTGIAPLNRLLLPSELNGDLELRQAAGTLHADMLLIYTIDTQFVVEDKAAPLTVVTLGLSPNQQARVVSTASAVLMDTRNGYVYGVAEATENDNRLTSAWTSSDAVDESRRRAETRAFEKLVGELETMWIGVVRTYAGQGRPAPTAVPG
jgi:hypothetical protein